MNELVIRLGILALLGLCTWFVVWLGRRYVERQRGLVLTAALPVTFVGSQQTYETASEKNQATVRILAFSSEDCRQCHQLQTPALQRVREALGNTVAIVDIDATREAELVERYHVLTVPTTVVLDREGRALAINYGFANTRKLLEQVDGLFQEF